ncbi:MAG TPA: phenylalanine--tRNA ligase subunit beta, partial [Bacillota bacterium]|nr:phenylalanine--tRNA ligase subunit beta [Bacillota bacterium]
KYVDIDGIEPEILAEKITKSGLEVDGIHYIGKQCKGVVTGYVTSCEKHPNADKLNVCQIDVGTEILQIVCGAPNIRQGVYVPVAKPDAVLPNNIKIKKVKLRDIESNGMICSLEELGFSEEHIPKSQQDGVFIFQEDVPIGEPIGPFLNIGDAVLELDLTPNRADCLNMMGIAYEVSAILNKEIHLPEVTVETIHKKVAEHVTVDVDDTALCPYYSVFMLEDVDIKPAPLWMQNHLLAAGIRPINNVVDITNYVLLEYGQPLHAFDRERVDSDHILVRRAKEGERLTTLDEKERILSSENLVITDGKEPIALAGVMGGANTEVHSQTTDLLLEAALFSSATTRRTVKQTGLRSEASTRYEKGLDPNRIKEAGLRACQLLREYAGAKVYEGVSEYNSLKKETKTVQMKRNIINKRLGTDITTAEIENILTRLRFPFDVEGNSFIVEIPSRRGDISIFEDMLEEVARIYGYDHLPYTLPKGSSQMGGLTTKQYIKREVNRYLQAAGLMEAKTYSLIDENKINLFLSPEIEEINPKPIQIAKPMTADHQLLRTSLLPELLNALTYNIARNEENIAYYEVGKVFVSGESTITNLPDEKLRVAGAITGNWVEHLWQGDTKKVDFYVVKGIVEGLFDHLDIPVIVKQNRMEQMHPGRCATLHIGEQIIGFMGQVHPTFAKKWDLNETYVFDINLDICLEHFEHVPRFTPIPKYPAIDRDIAFIMDKSIESGVIKDAIEKIGAPLVKQVHIFDVYTGENLPDGKKSVAFRLLYRDPDKTLTDAEIEMSYEQIIKSINETYETYVRV